MTVVDVLGVSNTSEAGPANVGAIGEVVKQVLGLCELLEVARPSDSLSEQRGDRHCDISHVDMTKLNSVGRPFVSGG